ncbi:MAG: ACT domain-containing protein [Methanomicrobiales archaeon]|nr:ACT domain-containing protein [Methanomicrobiales archaeon]
MPAISADLRKLLIRTNLVIFPEDFVVVYLPSNIKAIPGEWFRSATTRFAVVIQEPKTITMIITRRKWMRMQNMFEKYEVNGPLKVITFDVKLSFAAKGYMAAIGSVLTEANISAVPISSLKRDHILVSKADLPRTVRVLREFLSSCKKKPSGSSKKNDSHSP